MRRLRRPARCVLWLASLVTLLAAGAPAVAEEPVMPSVSPPIGVFGEVAHVRGVLQLSYRYSRQGFDGLQDGTTRLALRPPGYTIVPTSMSWDAHTFEAMWSPLDEITFVLTLPFLIKKMDQFDATTGRSFRTEARGFGDFTITLLYRVFEDRHSRVHLNLGVSLPSGSTTETAVMPSSPLSSAAPITVGTIERLPYSMQLGSGTVDLRPGFTYNGAWNMLYWGGQMIGVLHAGTNAQSYKQGNRYAVTTWFGGRWADWIATSLRLDWNHSFNPEGSDPLLDPGRSPAEDPSLQSARRLDVLFGLDFFVGGGRLTGTRISVEAGLPAYQNLDGPQLRTEWLITAGVQYAF